MSSDSAASPAEATNGSVSRLRQALPHGILLAASIFLFWSVTQIDAYTGGSGRIGPDAWPKAIIVFMGLLCAMEVLKRLFAKPKGHVDAALPEPGSGESSELSAAPVAAQYPAKLAGGIVAIAAYALLVSWIGFFVATALFLGVFPWIGGLRRPMLSAVLGIAGSFLLIVMFMRLAYISLPLGEGPFRSLSIGLLKLIGVN